MKLSICCLTNAPGARVASILERLRPFAGEIVIGSDTRADAERRRDYAATADVVVPIDFEFAERHLAELAERCSGDWILRIDDDEVPASGLTERLPWLITQQIEQYWVPRRWLYPSIDHWLGEPPWWPDYHNRLVRRNAGLRFSGVLHSGAQPVLPARFLEWPIYHLECVFKDRASREEKVTRNERIRPGLMAPGGGPLNAVYYLPELHARHDPMPVPAEDRATIAQVRQPPEYGAIITSLERHHRLHASERRAVHFRVHNASSAGWSPEADIRLAYRWRGCPGEGDRTSFPASVAPGETAIVPLVVTAPDRAGVFQLEVDLVHEHVRWFRQPALVDVLVEERDGR